MAGLVNLAFSVLRFGNGLTLNGDTLSANGDSPQLTATGAALIQRDLDISGAIVTQIVGGAGTPVQVTGSGPLASANLTGRGSVVVTVAGSVVSISGSAAGAGEVTSAQLTATGVTLGVKVDSLSGWAASAANLSATGSNLDGKINTLTANLTSTGVTLGEQITALSGSAASSANLTSTGATLVQRDLDISGGLEARIFQSGFTALNAANTVTASTGQQAWLAAQNNATNLSGNLTATGQNLSAIKVTGSSIVNTPNFTGIGGTAVILSGLMVLISGGAGGGGDVTFAQLAATGAMLDGRIDSLSGWSASAANLQATGTTLINLISAASAGVSTLNGASGVLTLAGAGNVTITTDGQTITASGSGGDTSSFATIANLAATGSTLDVKIGVLSGWSASAANLAATGSTLDGRITTVTNNLVTTGFNLNGKIDSLSGWSANIATNLGTTGSTLDGRITTVADNLATTGAGLDGKINTLSGWSASATNLGATGSVLDGRITTVATNLAATGSALDGKVNTLSGWAASATNLTATGVTLGGKADSLSGWAASSVNLTSTGSVLDGRINTVASNLTSTGVTLGAKVDALSGWSASALNLAASGTTLDEKINTLSGWSASSVNLATTGSTLDGRINTVTSNLTSTGVTLGGQLTSLSGWAASSANLHATGANLFQRDIDISGALAAQIAGGGTAVQITGSSNLATANFTGLGWVTITQSGATVVVSDVIPEGMRQNFQFGTSYTLQSSDLDRNVVMCATTANVITVPAISGAYFPTGASVLITQFNTGQVSVSPIHANVTVSGRGGALKMAGRYAQAALTMVSGNYWVFVGDITST